MDGSDSLNEGMEMDTKPMAPLKLVADKVAENLRASASSAPATIPFSPPVKTQAPDREAKAERIGTMLDKWRVSQGYRPLEDEDQNLTVELYMETFDANEVDPDAYDQLRLEAIKWQGFELRNCRQPPDFTPQLLIALWPALKTRREQEVGDRGRQLPAVSMSDCPLCFGCGWEIVPERGARRCSNGCRPRA